MSALLTRAGKLLYGQQWQSALARDLDVSDRTVRRWVCGATPVPVGVYVDLQRLVLERAALLDMLAEDLQEATAG